MRIRTLPPEEPSSRRDGAAKPDGGTGTFWFLIGVAFVAIGSTTDGGSLSNRAFVFYAVGATFIYLAWKGRVDRDAERGPVHETLPDEVDPGDDGEDEEWEDDRDELWRSP